MGRETVFIIFFLYAKLVATSDVNPEFPLVYPGGCINISLDNSLYDENSKIECYLYSSDNQNTFTIHGPKQGLNEKNFYFLKYIKSVDLTMVEFCWIDHVFEGYFLVFFVTRQNNRVAYGTKSFKLCHDLYDANCVNRPPPSPRIHSGLPERLEFDANSEHLEVMVNSQNLDFKHMAIAVCSMYEICIVSGYAGNNVIKIDVHDNIISLFEDDFKLLIEFDNFKLSEYSLHVISQEPDNEFVLTSVFRLTEKIFDISRDGFSLSWTIDENYDLISLNLFTVSTYNKDIVLIKMDFLNDYVRKDVNVFKRIDHNGIVFEEDNLDYIILYAEFTFSFKTEFIYTYHEVYDVQKILVERREKLMSIIIPCAVVGALLLILGLAIFIFRHRISRSMRNARGKA